MGSSSVSSWSVLFIVIVMTICVPESEQKQLVIPLRHSLSGSGSTTTELIKSSTVRSLKRHTSRNTNAKTKTKREVSLALSGGSDYTMRLQMGSGSEEAWVYMDTGSDLVWFPCSPFTCILCEGESPPLAPPVNISSAATVSCSSPLCTAAHSGRASDMCAAAGCPLDLIETSDCPASAACPMFYYAYADGSLVGRLHSHAVSVSPSLRIHGFTFACAHSALAEPIGVAGFGRGPLSMTAQLGPHLGTELAFSYCLVSHSFNASSHRHSHSPLILGRRHQQTGDFAYTALLDNPKKPYLYSVALLGVFVGNETVKAPHFLRKVDTEGRGGMVVDSGTTFTMLPAKMHDKVVEMFEKQLQGGSWERAEEVERKTGLMPCYRQKGRHVKLGMRLRVPRLGLRFGGGEAVELPRGNYWYEMRRERAGCLTLMNGGEEQEAATLGNYQQQGMEVVYDLDNLRIGFANRNCHQLWDSLNHTP